MKQEINQNEIESFIRQAFEQNYDELRLDSGHAISPDAKQAALNQVLLYWRMLREIAENVTDTEVRLSLPGLETSHGREYTIEGVVDIVRDNERTVMYDIKTHNAEYVRANLALYEQQLNVYAFIWKNLRRQALDEMAIIATDFSDLVRDALASENKEQMTYAMKQWQPIVPIAFEQSHVEETISKFGTVVDCIEEGCFAPPVAEELSRVLPGTRNIRFATQVCRNCDTRFSCSSYRQYTWQGHSAADKKMYLYYGDYPTDPEQESWRTANLDASPDKDVLRADFSGR
ncbi:MAG: PD-(D/E)XK nuclease family protein [Chloroflexota bacterium]